MFCGVLAVVLVAGAACADGSGTADPGSAAVHPSGASYESPYDDDAATYDDDEPAWKMENSRAEGDEPPPDEAFSEPYAHPDAADEALASADELGEFGVLADKHEAQCGFLCRLFGSRSSEGTGGSEGGAVSGDSAPTKASTSRAGPYRVQTYSRGYATHRAFTGGTIHYPADARPPFASVAVVPGFLASESSIRAWGPFLASHGIVTMTIGTNAPGDLPDARARALLGALEVLRTENARAGSPLNGRIDTARQAVMGWSMGGGGALIAASSNPQLKAAIAMAAWSPGVTFRNNRVPTQLFAATADTLAGGQSQGFYNSMPASTPKMLFEVQGSSHNVANSPSNHNGEIGHYGLAWLKTFLEDDERYRPFLRAQPSTRMATFRHNL